MAEKKKKGFIAIIQEKIRAKKKEKKQKSGEELPDWMKKLSGSERRRAEMVHKANQKRKK